MKAKGKSGKLPASTNREYQVQRIQRIDLVYDLLIAGLTRAEVIKFLREKHPEWKMCTRSVDNLIACAKRKLQEASETHRDEELGKALDRLDKLYQRSFAINDYKACAAIVKQRTELLGLAAPTKIEQTGEQAVRIEVVYADDQTPAQ